MKAFIFVALVASVAARSLDLETLRLARKVQTPLVTKVGDDLLKEQLKKDLVFGQEKQQVLDTTVIPTVGDKTVVGGIYNYDVNNVVDVDRVLSLEELYNTELFKEYLSLPLFRQYIQYPSFQRFIASVYFQRFYQLPAYKQYFVNPVLFYKYVYPIVQLFNTEYTLPSVYGQHEDVLGLQTLVDNVLLKNKNFLPYAYNNRFNVPTTTSYPVGTDATNYKFLLDKLYKTVVGQEIKTDVKLIPTQKVVVEPTTNQLVVEEPKIVDVQVDQKIVPVVDSVVPFTTDKVVDTVAITERDVLLLKELLRQNIITPEVYQAIVFGKINYTTVLRQVIARGGVSSDLRNLIISRLQVVDTVVPVTTTDSVVLSERNVVILKDLLQKDIITPEVYQAVLFGKVDFTVLLRQVLERRGITIDLINLIINRLVVVDSFVPTVTEQDVLLVKELLRQQIITPEVYQYVLVGKVDLFTLLRQVIVRRDVIDTIIPTVDTTVVLNERNIVLLKEFLRQQFISQEIYEAVLVGKVDFVTVLRQVLQRRGFTTDLINFFINRLVYVDSVVPTVTEQDVVFLKELLRQNLISQEIFQAVIFGKVDIYTVLRQILFRRDVVDTVVPYTSNIYNRFSGKDRYFDLINKLYGYKNLYNNEYSTVRDNTYNYNRYPIVA